MWNDPAPPSAVGAIFATSAAEASPPDSTPAVPAPSDFGAAPAGRARAESDAAAERAAGEGGGGGGEGAAGGEGGPGPGAATLEGGGDGEGAQQGRSRIESNQTGTAETLEGGGDGEGAQQRRSPVATMLRPDGFGRNATRGTGHVFSAGASSAPSSLSRPTAPAPRPPEPNRIKSNRNRRDAAARPAAESVEHLRPKTRAAAPHAPVGRCAQSSPRAPAAADALERFLRTYGLSHLVRAHEVRKTGFQVWRPPW